MRVPTFDPAAEYEVFRAEIDSGFQRVIADGQLVLGPEVEAFEKEAASMLQTPHAIAVGSGAAALHLALRALGIGPGDEVITVSNADPASVAAIFLVGASVRWVDVDAKRLTMDPDALAATITPTSRAVLPVHQPGLPADMQPILDLALRHNLLVIEDAALGFGCRYRGRHLGSLGDAGCISFHPTKLLPALGDAGMIVTPHVRVAERLISMRSYGKAPRSLQRLNDPTPVPWEVTEFGLNERMDDLQAVVLRVKLAAFDRLLAGRLRVANRYREALSELPVELPQPPPDCEVFHRAFAILLDDRNRVQSALSSRGISARTYYTPPMHFQPAYRHASRGPGGLPVTEMLAERLLYLPVHPMMTDAQVDHVVESLRTELAAGA